MISNPLTDVLHISAYKRVQHSWKNISSGYGLLYEHWHIPNQDGKSSSPHSFHFTISGKFNTDTLQRFRVRHGLSCVIGPVWPVGAGCYSKAALPMPLSKPLYSQNVTIGVVTMGEHICITMYIRSHWALTRSCVVRTLTFVSFVDNDYIWTSSIIDVK